MKPMITYCPDYYKEFKCIASACKHTCCAGWEIDVDESSLQRFSEHPDIASHIEGNSIVLDDNERCPFLLPDGLCDMILKHGEDFICDICREHPRFYNEFEDHEETGLGLVCEEACRLILDREQDFSLCPEKPLSDEIKTVFDINVPLSDALSKLKPYTSDSITRARFIKTLEVMDQAWTELIDRIEKASPSISEEKAVIDSNRRRFSNFTAYLLYRYPEETGFAVESTYLLADLVLTGTDIHEAARMFSGEIEYSDINIDKAADKWYYSRVEDA